MKKIYFLTLGLVALMLNTMAQDCPSGGGGYAAIKYTFGNPVHHCIIHVVGLPTGQTGWTVLVSRATSQGGGFIPTYGSNPSDFDVDVNQAQGTADFTYDCNHYAEAYVLVSHDDGVAITTCQINSFIDGGSLPIKLTSFTGRLKTDNEVTLDWTSTIEVESAHYEVQRSVDGKNYEKVGTLKAAGTSVTAIRYSFEDRLPAAGAYYYRLKQIDMDGKYEYSKVVYVNSKKGSGVVTKIFPNPFLGEVQLIGATSADLTPGNIKVFSIAGQRVNYRLVGANSIMIDPTTPNGVYILQFKEQRFKLVKSPGGTSY